jgi:hypothetical protein
VDFWAVAEKYGLPIAMLMFGVIALYYDWVVSGRRYREVCGQRDRLLRLALSGQRKAWQATDLAAALVQGAGEGEAGDASGD